MNGRTKRIASIVAWEYWCNTRIIVYIFLEGNLEGREPRSRLSSCAPSNDCGVKMSMT